MSSFLEPIRRANVKQVLPNAYICENQANGLLCNGNFYPMKYWFNGTDGKTLDVGVGKRLYVFHIVCYCVADTGSYANVSLSPTDFSAAFAAVGVTGIGGACAAIQDTPVNYLFDEGFILQANIQAGLDQWSMVYYAVIDLEPGKKKPLVIIDGKVVKE